MHYKIKSTDVNFTTDGLGRCMKGVGEVVYIANESRARSLIARGILENPFTSAEPVVAPKEPPTELIAITEANAFTDKLLLDEWAESEHGIKLKRNMKLENMQADFSKQYKSKMNRIDADNKALITSGLENK